MSCGLSQVQVRVYVSHRRGWHASNAGGNHDAALARKLSGRHPCPNLSQVCFAASTKYTAIEMFKKSRTPRTLSSEPLSSLWYKHNINLFFSGLMSLNGVYRPVVIGCLIWARRISVASAPSSRHTRLVYKGCGVVSKRRLEASARFFCALEVTVAVGLRRTRDSWNDLFGVGETCVLFVSISFVDSPP
jgi:hypothetical protein